MHGLLRNCERATESIVQRVQNSPTKLSERDLAASTLLLVISRWKINEQKNNHGRSSSSFPTVDERLSTRYRSVGIAISRDFELDNERRCSSDAIENEVSSLSTKSRINLVWLLSNVYTMGYEWNRQDFPISRLTHVHYLSHKYVGEFLRRVIDVTRC